MPTSSSVEREVLDGALLGARATDTGFHGSNSTTGKGLRKEVDYDSILETA